VHHKGRQAGTTTHPHNTIHLTPLGGCKTPLSQWTLVTLGPLTADEEEATIEEKGANTGTIKPPTTSKVMSLPPATYLMHASNADK